jgi:hypothetical protein
MVENVEPANPAAAVSAASTRALRNALLFVLLFLLVGLIASFFPFHRPHTAKSTKPSFASPTVEGEPVEQLFGLHRGLLRYRLKRMSKPFVGTVVRISGTVMSVQSPTSDTKYALLESADHRFSGVTLMFRVHFEPDFGRLAPGKTIRAACIYRGDIDPNLVRFEDCRFTP